MILNISGIQIELIFAGQGRGCFCAIDNNVNYFASAHKSLYHSTKLKEVADFTLHRFTLGDGRLFGSNSLNEISLLCPMQA